MLTGAAIDVGFFSTLSISTLRCLPFSRGNSTSSPSSEPSIALASGEPMARRPLSRSLPLSDSRAEMRLPSSENTSTTLSPRPIPAAAGAAVSAAPCSKAPRSIGSSPGTDPLAGREHIVEHAPLSRTQIGFRSDRLVGCEIVVESVAREWPQVVAETAAGALRLFFGHSSNLSSVTARTSSGFTIGKSG